MQKASHLMQPSPIHF